MNEQDPDTILARHGLKPIAEGPCREITEEEREAFQERSEEVSLVYGNAMISERELKLTPNNDPNSNKEE